MFSFAEMSDSHFRADSKPMLIMLILKINRFLSSYHVMTALANAWVDSQQCIHNIRYNYDEALEKSKVATLTKMCAEISTVLLMPLL